MARNIFADLIPLADTRAPVGGELRSAPEPAVGEPMAAVAPPPDPRGGVVTSATAGNPFAALIPGATRDPPAPWVQSVIEEASAVGLPAFDPVRSPPPPEPDAGLASQADRRDIHTGYDPGPPPSPAELSNAAQPLFAVQAPTSQLERQSRLLIKDAQDFEDGLRQRNATPNEIAAAVNHRYGTEVTPQQIEGGDVWWRIKGPSDLKSLGPDVPEYAAEARMAQAAEDSENIPAPMDVDARPSVPQQPHGVEGGASPGPRLSPEMRARIIDLAGTGMSVPRIAQAVETETGQYVRDNLVQEVIGSAQAKANAAESRRQRVAASWTPDRRAAQSEIIKAILARPETQEWLVQRGQELAKSKGQTVWTPDLVEALGMPEVRTMTAAKAAEALRAAFPDVARGITENAVRKKRSALGYKSEAPKGIDPNKFKWTPQVNARLAELMDQAPNATERARILNAETGAALTPKAVQRQSEKLRAQALRDQGQEPMFAASGWHPKAWLDWIGANPNVGREDATAERGVGDGGSPPAPGQQPRATESGGRSTQEPAAGGDNGVRQSFRVRDFLGRVIDAPPNAVGLRQAYLFLHPPKVTWPFTSNAQTTLRNLDYGVPNWMAKAHVSEIEPNVWEVKSFKIRKNQVEKGLTPEFLDAVQSELGGDIRPADTMTADAWKAWRAWERQGSRWNDTSIDRYINHKGKFYSPDALRHLQVATARLATSAPDVNTRNKARREFNEISDLVDKLPPEDNGRLLYAVHDLATLNHAALIDDIPLGAPHPGRVIGLHGTRHPEASDKFDITKSADFGIHVGTVEQAHTFSTGHGDFIQRVGPIQSRVSVDDLSSHEKDKVWLAYSAAAEATRKAYDAHVTAKSAKDRAAGWRNWLKRWYLEHDATKQLNRAQALGAKRDELSRRLVDIDTVLQVEGRLNIPVVLDVSNPLTMDDLGDWDFEDVIDAIADKVQITAEDRHKILTGSDTKGSAQLLRDAIIEAGYDSVRYRNIAEGTGWSYIAIKPSTVRSALSQHLLYSSGFRRDARTSAAATVMNGRDAFVRDSVVDSINAAIAPHLDRVPAGTRAGALSSAEPVKGKKGRVLYTFVMPNGEGFEIEGDLSLLSNRAVYDPGSFSDNGTPKIGFIHFATPSPDLVVGDLYHEITHAVLRQDGLGDDARAALVQHADDLSILAMPIAQFKEMVGADPTDAPDPERTILEVYTEVYGARKYPKSVSPERIAAILRQDIEEEAIAHMVQLYHHGALSPDQVAPVRDVLDAILDGSIWRRGQGYSASGVGDGVAAAVGASGGLDMSPAARRS